MIQVISVAFAVIWGNDCICRIWWAVRRDRTIGHCSLLLPPCCSSGILSFWFSNPYIVGILIVCFVFKTISGTWTSILCGGRAGVNTESWISLWKVLSAYEFWKCASNHAQLPTTVLKHSRWGEIWSKCGARHSLCVPVVFWRLARYIFSLA